MTDPRILRKLKRVATLRGKVSEEKFQDALQRTYEVAVGMGVVDTFDEMCELIGVTND